MKLSPLFACFAAVITALSASGADSAIRRPNIIFILVDDLRWDEVDYPFVRVPNIQRIAREGVRFQNAFVTTPLCSPSRSPSSIRPSERTPTKNSGNSFAELVTVSDCIDVDDKITANE
jgi:hypothetical protein